MKPEDLINKVLVGEIPPAALFQEYRKETEKEIRRAFRNGFRTALEYALQEIENSSHIQDANFKIRYFLMRHVFRDI